MNIVFLLKVLEIGGVEIVSAALANKFVSQGHSVCIFVFDSTTMPVKKQLDSRVHIYEGVGLRYSNENVDRLRRVLINEKIDIIINQWGLHWLTVRTAKNAKYGLNCKLITEYHNDPSTNGQMQNVDISLSQTSSNLKRLFLLIKRKLIRVVTGLSMRYVYENSDLYLLLSPCFVNDLKKFIWLKSGEKIRVMPNPMTIKVPQNYLQIPQKKKQIVMVGRIDFNQKRNFRAVEVWKFLEHKYPEWHFSIVGDGADMPLLKKCIAESGLKNISLEGFQNPIKFYEDSAILLLTSEYEGFGLVLIEGMAYGTVPVALGSYSSVFDIIQNEENGFVIPYNRSVGFNPEIMAQQMELLMQNESLLKKMSQNAISSSKAYSMDKVYDRWMLLLKNMENFVQ